jgi:hypothetical protein
MAHLAADQAAGILTNDSIIELYKLGFGEDILLGKIRNSACNFDVSIDGLKVLKAAGLPDSVISAMIDAASSTLVQPTDSDPNDPLSPHAAGIYVYLDNGDQPALVKLNPSVYTQAKSGGFFKSAMTFGIAKIKTRAVIPGIHARQEISVPKPTFYFYFEETESGLSQQTQATTSPAEFILSEFTINNKANTRELVVGQMNAFGAQSGALDKTVRPFDFEQVGEGTFKVIPTRPLLTGEYCFYYAGATPLPTYGYVGAVGGSKLYDFSIRSANSE